RDWSVTGVQTCALPISIWFLPLLGSILYLALGVNRIRRRAISLGVHKVVPRPIPEHLGAAPASGVEHLESLARVVGRVVEQPLRSEERRVGKEGSDGRR